MGLALFQLRKWQRTVSGIFCHEKLIFLHWSAFLAATVFDELSYLLNFMDFRAGYSISQEKYDRIKFTSVVFILLAIVMYLVV